MSGIPPAPPIPGIPPMPPIPPKPGIPPIPPIPPNPGNPPAGGGTDVEAPVLELVGAGAASYVEEAPPGAGIEPGAPAIEPNMLFEF